VQVLNNQNLLLEALTNVVTNPRPREQNTNDKLTAFLTLLDFTPNATPEICCNMPFFGAIATIAPKKFCKKVMQKVLWY
jgi:hypothetical protein